MPFLSFIVGFRDRDLDRVKLFLNSLKDQNDPDFELLFLDYGSVHGLAMEVSDLCATYSFVKYIYYDARGLNWNRARCMNMAVKKCSGKHIFTCDIDFIFDSSFVTVLKELSATESPYYFKVGFLDKTTDPNQAVSSLKASAYSDEDAIGALFISKTQFNAMNGFDEYFEIWGLEDNDLFHRLKAAGVNITQFHKKVLIWHVWHLPAKQAEILPEGWLKLMSDYLKNKITRKAANRQSPLDQDRPILSKPSDQKKLDGISFSKYYLPVFLSEEFLSLEPGASISIRFDFSQYFSFAPARVNKITHRINRLASKRAWPVKLHNPNMDAYLSPRAAADCIRFFIKSNPELIRDYFLPSDFTKEQVLLMKK